MGRPCHLAGARGYCLSRVATLSRLARLSPYYFCRAFKQSLGVTPHRYHAQRRIERAKPNSSVTEIGLALGFSETSSFTSDAFRRITGLTPSAYRQVLQCVAMEGLLRAVAEQFVIALAFYGDGLPHLSHKYSRSLNQLRTARTCFFGARRP